MATKEQKPSNLKVRRIVRKEEDGLRVLEATVGRLGKGESMIVLKEVDVVGGGKCW